jgi:hypothetical protein
MNTNIKIYENFKSRFPEPKEGDLRVWWIPQVPMEMFEWPVADLAQASLLLDALAAYDDFQFQNRVKGDYCNTGGLNIFRDGDWEDWETDEGDSFDEYRSATVSP